MEKTDVSIVVPCYNEGAFLKKAFKELIKTMDSARYSYEIIFIDDKSKDETAKNLRELVKTSDKTRAFFHGKNLGRGGTVKEGFGKAKGKIVGFIDIDLEVHCRYIPAMVQAINDGCDGATAWRYYHVSLSSLHRFLLSRVYHVLEGILIGLPYNDTESGFKFFKKQKIMPLAALSKDDRWFFDTEIMALCHLNGLKIREIPAVFQKNPESKSTVRLVHDTIEYFQALWAFRKRAKKEKTA
ncbi:MAG: glycosyltransferase family 2 protein [Candidatus Diapherotrites archaeon]